MFRFYQSDCFTEDMDDSSHRENGRHKPTQSQWLMQHQPSMKQIMAIMAERDAAIQERNLAISEKKTAITERDMAILQRDSAIAERNNAIMERDNAISTLYRENAMNNNSMPQCAPECQIERGVKNIHIPQQHTHHQTHMVESQHEFRHMHLADAVTISSIGPNPAKPRRVKRAKEAKPVTTARKPSKSSKRVKQEGEDLNKAIVVISQEWKSGHNTAGSASDDFNRSVGSSKQNWKDQDLGLNQVPFDETTMPVPVCSCTGVLRPCYKWGSGGWQSSCCTTNLSMYPLPAVPNKRHTRVGGRKMSGSAFTKLLSRLAGEGNDLSLPVDLREHWAKHGTNRYITIK